jgi:hypothetical protein
MLLRNYFGLVSYSIYIYKKKKQLDLAIKSQKKNLTKKPTSFVDFLFKKSN